MLLLANSLAVCRLFRDDISRLFAPLSSRILVLLVYDLRMILLPNYHEILKFNICMALTDQEQNEARFCALRWATSLYDSQHCPSLYICMLSAADPKLDIR